MLAKLRQSKASSNFANALDYDIFIIHDETKVPVTKEESGVFNMGPTSSVSRINAHEELRIRESTDVYITILRVIPDELPQPLSGDGTIRGYFRSVKEEATSSDGVFKGHSVELLHQNFKVPLDQSLIIAESGLKWQKYGDKDLFLDESGVSHAKAQENTAPTTDIPTENTALTTDVPTPGVPDAVVEVSIPYVPAA